jgi:hypothetical protein
MQRGGAWRSDPKQAPMSHLLMPNPSLQYDSIQYRFESS